MPHYSLSYVITTYNKLPFLKQVLRRLTTIRRSDEEIVVCDGGSIDGTTEYLQQLYDSGVIQQFISERDKGEAHGFNKGMLLSKGEIIKIITDDDAFCYSAIRHAADFMLTHPEIDVMSGNTWHVSIEDLSHFSFYKYSYDHYLRWYNYKESVNMIGLPLLIRRSSLALTGLFYTGMVQVDGEFTYRITSLDVNIAWSTAILSIRIENPQSNFRNVNIKDSQIEAEKMQFFYKGVEHTLYYWLRNKSKFVRMLISPLRLLKKIYIKIFDSKKTEELTTKRSNFIYEPGQDLIVSAFQACDQFMQENNVEINPKIIYQPRERPLSKVLKNSKKAAS